MKKLILCVFIVLFCPAAFALNMITSCPSGYVQVNRANVFLVDESCPSGYTAAGSVSSCLLSSPSGSCYLFIPANEAISDSTGAYEYASLCELS